MMKSLFIAVILFISVFHWINGLPTDVHEKRFTDEVNEDSPNWLNQMRRPVRDAASSCCNSPPFLCSCCDVLCRR